MAVCATTYATMLTISPLPLMYIDTNRSRFVSIEEALNSIDVDDWEVLGQPDCIEYFWLKDGGLSHLVSNTVPLLVGLLYGTTLFTGILPFQPRASWDGHLFGAVAGVVTVWWLAKAGSK